MAPQINGRPVRTCRFRGLISALIGLGEIACDAAVSNYIPTTRRDCAFQAVLAADRNRPRALSASGGGGHICCHAHEPYRQACCLCWALVAALEGSCTRHWPS